MGDGDRPKILAFTSPVEKASASKSIQTSPQKQPTSADIAQRRLKVVQAMLPSDVSVYDPIGGTPDPCRLSSKSSKESSTVMSGAKSGIGSSTGSGTPHSNHSTMRFSKMKSRSRLREGSLATGDGQNTEYSQVQEDAPKEKKPSIFGVARSIRKASSKKSKSSNKGTSLINDTNLFKGASPMRTSIPSTVSSAPKAAAAAATAIVEGKRESDALLMPPSANTSSHVLTGTDPFSNLTSATHGDGGWEGSNFFRGESFRAIAL